MKLKDIYEAIDAFSPFSAQEAWDNSGLVLGDENSSYEGIFISLDASHELALKLPPSSLLITHHPLIFKGLKSLAGNLYPQKILLELIRKNCALICVHTNFDKSHLNAYFTETILGFKIEAKEDFLIYTKVEEQDFLHFAKKIQKRLNLDVLRLVKARENASNIAICAGSGSDLIPLLKKGTDTFITGDLRYHAALEARENALNLIDANHYHSELCFAQCFMELLQKQGFSSSICSFIDPFTLLKEHA